MIWATVIRLQKPSENGSTRGRYREFAIGRHWWVMPTVMLGGQVLAFLLLNRWTGFDGTSAWDWVLFVSLMIGSPTLAAILLSPGFTRYHLAMAIAAIFSGGVVFSFVEGGTWILVIVSAIVTGIQVFVVRMTGRPPWLIRPAPFRRTPKASIRWLLGMTVVAVVLIAWIRQSDDSDYYLTSLVYLGLALVTAMAGNVVARLRRPQVGWSILVVAVVLGAIVNIGIDSGFERA